MIIFNIFNTLTPTKPELIWGTARETKEVFIYTLSIPEYVLDFLRSRDDIALLSTWGKFTNDVSEAFGFAAKNITMEENTYGIAGRFATVKNLDNVSVWVDDQMLPHMREHMTKRGVLTIKPRNGFISEEQLAQLIAHVEQN